MLRMLMVSQFVINKIWISNLSTLHCATVHTFGNNKSNMHTSGRRKLKNRLSDKRSQMKKVLSILLYLFQALKE